MNTHTERTDDRALNTQYRVMLSGYQWFANLFPALSGMAVLDAACGEGYGSDLLAGKNAVVTGIDCSVEAIDKCIRTYRRPGLVFKRMDAERMEFTDAAFDAVVSQDTVEHVADDRTFISETARVLRVSGTAVFFTPFSQEHNNRPDNPFHVREYSPETLRALLGEWYREITLFGRKRGEELEDLERTFNRVRRADILSLRRFVPQKPPPAGKTDRALREQTCARGYYSATYRLHPVRR